MINRYVINNYEIGDKIKIRDDLIVDEEYYHIFFSEINIGNTSLKKLQTFMTQNNITEDDAITMLEWHIR